MEEVYILIKSPAFWFASVVVAFVMSLLATYVKDFIDQKIKERSKEKDEQARKRQADFVNKVKKLTENPHILSLYQSNIVYQKLRQVLYLLVCYVFSGLALHNAANGNFIAAATLLVTAILTGITILKIVSKQLYDLRSLVNAALDDDDTHFNG